METKRLTKAELQVATQALRAGEIVAFPTETVYGLGADACQKDAVKKVFLAKGRPSDNPLIVHVYDFSQVEEFVENFHPLTKKIVEHFWPGPLTLVFEAKPNAFPKEVSAGLTTVSFRMPDQPLTLELIHAVGSPLVGPSANTSGKPSPTTSDHVYHDLQGKIFGILEGGATKIGVESTVLDLSQVDQAPMILRPGATTKEQLEQVLGIEIRVDRHLVQENEPPRSPGMKYKHYAPDTKVVMVQPEDWQLAVEWSQLQKLKTGIMAGPSLCETVREQVAAVYEYQEDSVEAATRGLFAGLRALDEPQFALDLILVVTYPEDYLGNAYMNRLKKAANREYFNPVNVGNSK